MLIALALAAASPTVTVPPQPVLTRQIAARDAEFFGLLFEGCDPRAMRALLAPDFEMYHDKDGVVARSGEAMVAGYARSCEVKKKPDAWRSRRALEPASLSVHPIPGYGAVEDGTHVFFERRGNGPEKKVGRARFTQLWALTPSGWRLKRVFSYAHEAVK